MRLQQIAADLAFALLADRLTHQGMLDRAAQLFGEQLAWMPGLAQRIVNRFGDGGRPRRAVLCRFLQRDRAFKRACLPGKLTTPGHLLAVPVSRPVATLAAIELPELATCGQIASWLGLTSAELRGFATHRDRTSAGPMLHYCHTWVRKASGDPRLIEAPKPRLKALQRRLLEEVLDRVPVHAAAHGFCRGRSVRTYVTPHLGQHVVLRLDLCDFFPSIRYGRILGLFMALGLPEDAARLLAGLTVTVTPIAVFDDLAADDRDRLGSAARRLYRRAHLPQGAPTSPALANLCAYGLDRRLTGLAVASGAAYTRYADDLLFSGDADFARRVEAFHVHAAAIALEEGFPVRFRKTRIMRRSTRQHAAGVVLNVRPNVRRQDYDRLKATLFQCATRGPASQNHAGHGEFRAHLRGRIAHVASLNPTRGRKLRALFDAIDWPGEATLVPGR